MLVGFESNGHQDRSNKNTGGSPIADIQSGSQPRGYFTAIQKEGNTARQLCLRCPCDAHILDRAVRIQITHGKLHSSVTNAVPDVGSAAKPVLDNLGDRCLGLLTIELNVIGLSKFGQRLFRIGEKLAEEVRIGLTNGVRTRE